MDVQRRPHLDSTEGLRRAALHNHRVQWGRTWGALVSQAAKTVKENR